MNQNSNKQLGLTEPHCNFTPYEEAAMAVGIRGFNQHGDEAMMEFQLYCHERQEKLEKHSLSCQEIYDLARDWWQFNRYQFVSSLDSK